MRYSFFTALRTVTARSPMMAIRNADAFYPSCSNQLMVANQNAHAFRPNSIVAKKRMPKSLVGAMTRTMSASWHNSVHDRFFCIFCFLNSSALFSLAFHFSDVLERYFLNGSLRMVMRKRKCQDISVGRNQRSLFRSSRALADWRMS